MKRLQTAAIALLFLSSAASAATSPWVETPGGDVPEWQTVVTGAIIILAVYADQLRRQRG